MAVAAIWSEYTKLLEQHGIVISMSRSGNPHDNARCESFMKTLKYEEVYRQEYRDLGEARSAIARFLEKVYNQKRLHSALGYCSPAEFESNLMAAKAPSGTSRGWSDESAKKFARAGSCYQTFCVMKRESR